ncbi:hypothetical protein ACS0PU_006548 [Formica fusca]
MDKEKEKIGESAESSLPQERERGNVASRLRETERTRTRANSFSKLEEWIMKGEEEKGKKRKRMEEEVLEKEIFKRSNRLVRSPQSAGREERVGEGERGKSEGSVDGGAIWLVLDEIKKMRAEIAGGREEVREEIKILESKMIKIEEGWSAREKELENRIGKLEKSLEELIRKETSEDRNICIGSRKGSGHGSVTECVGLGNSDNRLSNWEVVIIRKWVTEKEKEERKCNIVIKGLAKTSELWKEQVGRIGRVQKFIKENIDVDCKVLSCRISGPVVITKIENDEKKGKL